MLALLFFWLLAPGAAATDLQTWVLPSAQPERLAAMLAPLLEPGGTALAFQGRVILKTSPQRHARLQPLIAGLDHPPQTVHILIRVHGTAGPLLQLSTLEGLAAGIDLHTLGHHLQHPLPSQAHMLQLIPHQVHDRIILITRLQEQDGSVVDSVNLQVAPDRWLPLSEPESLLMDAEGPPIPPSLQGLDLLLQVVPSEASSRGMAMPIGTARQAE